MLPVSVFAQNVRFSETDYWPWARYCLLSCVL